jgi:hypothetical protein
MRTYCMMALCGVFLLTPEVWPTSLAQKNSHDANRQKIWLQRISGKLTLQLPSQGQRMYDHLFGLPNFKVKTEPEQGGITTSFGQKNYAISFNKEFTDSWKTFITNLFDSNKVESVSEEIPSSLYTVTLENSKKGYQFNHETEKWQKGTFQKIKVKLYAKDSSFFPV